MLQGFEQILTLSGFIAFETFQILQVSLFYSNLNFTTKA